MKEILVIIATLFNLEVVAQIAHQQESANAKIDNSEVTSIRKIVLRIIADSSHQKIIIKDASGESAEGGEIKKYYYRETICRVVAVFFGETGNSSREYYFDAGKLIFMYERVGRYNEPIYGKSTKPVKVEENRFYFHDSKLFKWLAGKKIMSNLLYSAKQKELLGDMNEFLKINIP